MIYTAKTLPEVSPMMARKIFPRGDMEMVGGVLILDQFEVEEVGLVTERFLWDADIVDCSYRIYEITCAMSHLEGSGSIAAFPSRRWRNIRNGMDGYDDAEVLAFFKRELPLIYLGNPVRLFYDETEGITVQTIPEFRIRSGVELGF